METEWQVRDIAREVLGDKEISIKPIEREGGDSQVFQIVADGEVYYFRTGGARCNYDIEHELLRRLKGVGVSVPEPIYANIDTNRYPIPFSILRELSGKDLLTGTKVNTVKCVKEAGKELQKVHSLVFPGFGAMDAGLYRQSGKLAGGSKSWYELIVTGFASKMDSVKKQIVEEKKENFKNSKLAKEQIKKVLTIVDSVDEVLDRLEKARELFEINQGHLLHGDLNLLHMFVQGGRFVGFIDFIKTFVGDPFYDIAYFSVMTHGDKYYRVLLEGSGLGFDETKFSLYRLVTAAGKIKTRYVEHNYLHKYPKILDIAVEELSK